MVILKKLKAATLMETMVATVLIVVIFMIASLILTTIFKNSIYNNTDTIENRIEELRYLYHYGKIDVPYSETLLHWNIEVEEVEETDTTSVLVFEVKNKYTPKHFTKVFYK